jgi:hypothetical protein
MNESKNELKELIENIRTEIFNQYERIKLSLNELEPTQRGYIELVELLLRIEKQIRRKTNA